MRRELKVYTLYVAGIFGRNRKAKNGMFKLTETPADQPADKLAVIKMAHERMVEEKVKPGALYNIVESDEYVEDREGGFRVHGFQLGKAREIQGRATWTHGS